MDDLKNTPLYQVAKKISFQLIPISGKTLLQREANKATLSEDISLLVKNLEGIHHAFCETFLYKKEEYSEKTGILKEISLKKRLRIKHNWVKIYIENDFSTNKKNTFSESSPKIYHLSEINSLLKILVEQLNGWNSSIEQLKSFLDESNNSQKRRKEIGFYIKELKGRRFDFIKGFVESIHNPENPYLDEQIGKLKIQIQEALKQLQNCERDFFSSQNSGLEVAKASFNFYTINKENKAYFENKEKKIYESLNSPLDKSFFRFEEFNKQTGQNELKFEVNPSFLQSIGFPLDILDKWSLDKAYAELKAFKANAKNHFLEDVKKGEFTKVHINDIKEKEIKEKVELKYENLERFHPLFSCEKENFESFVIHTQKIKELEEKMHLAFQDSQNKSDETLIEKEIKGISLKRGSFFNKPNEKIQTDKYDKLCKLYRKIAQKRGLYLAKAKGLEYEKMDAEKTQFWSLIMEENNKRYLLLIPKGNENNTGKSKEFLEKITTKEEEGEVVIHHFSSLSLKVLNKLCFKELNQSFIGEVLKELRISSPNKSYFTIKKGFINLKRFDALIKEQSSLIEFFQDVLKSSFAKNYLDIRNFGGLDEVLKKNYQQIELFESDLEKACYIKKEVFLTKQEKENFLTNFNISVFEISSYDLRIKNENRKEIVTHHRDKVHTERWLDLWKRNANNKNYDYTTRLHHEINITYREADEKLKKKIRKSTLLPCYRNRFGKDQFTLSTTIFLNSTAAKSELSFSQDENFEKKIADFNKEFNTSHNEVFTRSYRINRGEKEMATLCVTKSKNPLQEFLKFETYILKDEEIEKEITRLDGTKTKKKVIDNISYFIDDETLFYKNDTGYIDLAQAKLIKGKIVQNGDQNTYLKLKELLAKRRLFELFANENIDNNSKIEIDKSIYVTDKNNIKIPIYWLTEEQRYSQKIKQKLELTLKVYLQTLEIKNKHESIETLIKINHLRDAITANIVGIVHYLQKQFPGEIYIEHKNTKEEKLSLLESANEDISRNLEWALYRKLQESGLVPPDIKQSTFLEEEFQEKQFGIIKFAQEKNCPYHEGKQQLLNENDYVCVGARCIFKKNVEIERVGFEYVSKLQRNEEEE